MREEKPTDNRGWYSRPLSHNPKAILPLFLALIGAACWQAGMFLPDNNLTALVLVGGALFLAGLVGSFVFRHYRVAALGLVVSLVSPLFWYFYLLGQAFGGWFMPFPCPLFVSEGLEMHPALFWLCLQVPLVFLALRVCPWPHRVKAVVVTLVLGGLVCFFAVVTAQAQREVAAAPRITDVALAAVYAGHDTASQKRWEHQRIVLTGAIYSNGDGLMGNGSPNVMHGNIECDIVVGQNALQGGQTVTLLGTCLGKDRL